jgi:hypothetical protein
MTDKFEDDVSFFVNYIFENFIGVVLLFSIFVIVYFVDCICQYNSKIFSMPTGIISPVTQGITTISNSISKKNRKNKK